MKAIIALALFACVASAQWNFTAQHLGFCDQLNLTAAQTETDLQCFSDIHQSIANVMGAVQNLQANNLLNAASAALQAIVDYKNAQVSCQEHFRDLFMYIVAQTGTTNLSSIFQQNFMIYYAEIFQQVGLFMSDIQDGNAYQAGATQGYILQILIGAEKPEVTPIPQLNYTGNVQFNQSQFLADFIQTYFGDFGANQDQIDALYQCANQAATLSDALTNLTQQTPTTLQGQLAVAQQGVNLLFGVAEACIPGIEAEFQVYAPIMQQFQAAPVVFIYNMIHNVLLNFSQMEQEYLQEIQFILNGQYTQAGQAEYNLAQMILNQN